MKRFYLILIAAILIQLSIRPLYAQQGTILEGKKYSSAILGEDVAYAVYLPPNYNNETRRYPVVYLLHGFTDNESGWVQFGQISKAMDEGISAGTIPPMVIIMPDGGITWYANDYLGKFRWEDMFIDEFIPFMEKLFRIRSKKQFRAVAGLSMGGYGALHLSMNHTNLFSTCIALSAAIHPADQIISMSNTRYKNYGFAKLFGEYKDKSKRANEHFQKYNALNIIEKTDKNRLNSVRYYIDCGDDDGLSMANSYLHIRMRELGIKHEYRVRDGSHSWPYWRSGIVDGLKFFTKVVNR